MNRNALVDLYKKHFAFPKVINWGYALFLCSLGTLIVYLIQWIITKSGILFNPTSLVGGFLVISFLVIMALLLPAAALFVEKPSNENIKPTNAIGKNTGLGVVLLSMISGISIPLVTIPLHNFSTWICLKLEKSLVLPAFFIINDNTSSVESSLSYMTNTVIPAFGISLFFTGLMWSCFSEKDKKFAYIIIPLSLAVFSLNPTDFLSLIVCGLWLCYLRSKSQNIIAPFSALIASGLMEMYITKYVESADITMLQVVSDMSPTILYSSVPSIIAGVILFAVFAKPLNEFGDTYKRDSKKRDEGIKPIESLRAGNGLALYIALIIFIVLWIFVFKGVKS